MAMLLTAIIPMRVTATWNQACSTIAFQSIVSLLSEPLLQPAQIVRPVKQREADPLGLPDLAQGSLRPLPPGEYQDGIGSSPEELEVAPEEHLPGRRPIHEGGHRVRADAHPALVPDPGGHPPGAEDVADPAHEGRGSVW